MNIKKITAFTLAVSVTIMSGCAVNTKQDEEQISSIPGQFIEAFVNADDDTIDEIVEGNDVRESLENLTGRSIFEEERYNIILHAISLTEIDNVEILEIDKREGTARAKVNLSYIDIEDFVTSTAGTRAPYYAYTNQYTYDDYIEAMDSFDKTERTMNLNYSYSESDESWMLNKASATRLINLFVSPSTYLITPVKVTPDQAADTARLAFGELAAAAETTFMDLNLQDLRVYDSLYAVGPGPESDVAAQEFVEAYMTYIMEHDPEFEIDYYIRLTGYAPSTEYLCEQLNSREFLINYYMNILGYMDPDADMEQLADEQAALVYSTLVQAIPDATPQTYEVNLMYDPYAVEPVLWTYESLILVPEEAMAEPADDLVQNCAQAAIERLYTNGEITDDEYDSLIDSLSSGEGPDSNTEHPNQAVDTYEEVPSWCDDDRITYGYSSADENGFSMFYSKRPGVLDTVGYCFEDDGLYIANYYDMTFNVGDSFEVDWWIDDEQIVDAQIVVITEPFTNKIEVFLPSDQYNEDSYIEMRLWEPGHTHVISYVRLTR